MLIENTNSILFIFKIIHLPSSFFNAVKPLNLSVYITKYTAKRKLNQQAKFKQ